MFWHYLVRRTLLGCLYIANQKSSITAVDGFGDMQEFSYNCVSHHNTLKSYFSWCSHQYYKPWFALCVVWRRNSICVKKILSKQDFVFMLPEPEDHKSHTRNLLHFVVPPTGVVPPRRQSPLSHHLTAERLFCYKHSSQGMLAPQGHGTANSS